jgi:PcfJ-like protein
MRATSTTDRAAEKRRRAEAAEHHAMQMQAREDALRAALTRSTRTTKTHLDRTIAMYVAELPSRYVDPFRRLVMVVEKRSPRQIEPKFLRALARLATLQFVGNLEDWRPHGKRRSTVFRSLADHVAAKFPVPALFWDAFFDEVNAPVIVPLVAHVARGGSLFDYVKTHFVVPLTRAMCHALSTTPAEVGFVQAIRDVQVRAAGGEQRLAFAWRRSEHGRALGAKQDETFWATVLEWFAHAPMLDFDQIGPICDYIAHRRGQDAKFSMKGRTPLAMMRAMQEWHADLGKRSMVKNKTFVPSGLREAEFNDERLEPDGSKTKEIWRMSEVLTAHDLFEEGRRMGHCVFSYASRIQGGDTSIWRLTMEDGLGETGNWAMATIEVKNAARFIAQARGRFNRSLGAREQRVLLRWASLNGLSI